MKNKYKIISIILLCSVIAISSISTQAKNKTTREIILSAMKDEMARNMEQLQLENLQRPFFISYTILDAKTMEVTATLGSIIYSNENHFRSHNVRVMVGDYKLNDENFRDRNPGGFQWTLLRGTDRLPLEDDYYGIRRALWIATDRVYKSASENYERKIAALDQQELSEEEKALEDFSQAPIVKYTEPARLFDMERTKWEKTAKEISAIFQNYPDIYSSQIRIYFYQGDTYFLNSEGTEVVQPLTLVDMYINASTQAVDGEPLDDITVYIGMIPQDLPATKILKQNVKEMAERLILLRTAPVFEDSYTGPVMFENQAVAELIAQRLFTGPSGLLTFRQPIMASSTRSRPSQSQSLEDKIGTRILSRDLTVKAMPAMDTFSGVKLIGSFKVDAEGVKPPEELVLVENGILKTLLSNRTPTTKVKESNGHQRPLISRASSRLGPSVILMTTSDGKSKAEMKSELLQLAKDEGLDYGIIVRKISSITRPIIIYRVSVEDGKEELVRSVKLGRLSLSSLRRIYASADAQFLYQRGGVPASFIVPQSLIFEELEVEQEKRTYTPKLPVVPSPLLR